MYKRDGRHCRVVFVSSSFFRLELHVHGLQIQTNTDSAPLGHGSLTSLISIPKRQHSVNKRFIWHAFDGYMLNRLEKTALLKETCALLFKIGCLCHMAISYHPPIGWQKKHVVHRPRPRPPTFANTVKTMKLCSKRLSHRK